jgi:hypothetical protein
MPVFLVTQEVEIRKIMVQSQPKETVFYILSQKNPSQKGAGEFKPQYHEKKAKIVVLFKIWNLFFETGSCYIAQTSQTHDSPASAS